MFGRRRFFGFEDFSILETKEECFIACLSFFEDAKAEDEAVADIAPLSGREGFGVALEVFARMEVRFLPDVGACRHL